MWFLVAAVAAPPERALDVRTRMGAEAALETGDYARAGELLGPLLAAWEDVPAAEAGDLWNLAATLHGAALRATRDPSFAAYRVDALARCAAGPAGALASGCGALAGDLRAVLAASGTPTDPVPDPGFAAWRALDALGASDAANALGTTRVNALARRAAALYDAAAVPGQAPEVVVAKLREARVPLEGALRFAPGEPQLTALLGTVCAATGDCAPPAP